MKISVVIPAYNEAKYLEKCLKSIFSQSYPAYEVIVVDNNSIDETTQIAKSMGATVYRESVQGIIPARNRGFNEAKGEIIARTDADTVVSKDWLFVINNRFEKDNKLDAVSGPAIYGIKLLSPFVHFLVFAANERIFGHSFLYGPNFAIRKTAWERVRDEVCLDDDRVHEDADISIHLGKKGKISFDPNMKAKTSPRRLVYKPSTLLVDYLIKFGDTIGSHRQFRISRLASSIKQKINN